MKNVWNILFLEERPSIGLSFFRPFVALTVGLHMIPSFFHLDDNFLSTALKTFNYDFFPAWFIDLVQKSPDTLVYFFVAAFYITWFCFLIGLFSQISCILMTACCYYFYALNAFHIGTLSWDILLVTLFLMCITSYHGDYFSMDALRRGDVDAWRRPRPFFIQRLLQLQTASTFFFTGLYKITGEGNWISGNPIYYLMNYPIQGVTKNFLLKEWMAGHSTFCYVIGLMIVATEMSMSFLLFIPKTRRAAIVLGLCWHVLLVLTLDVPMIFLFLFPAQMMLFIHPQKIIEWIEAKRRINAQSPRPKVIYDGDCGFCRSSVRVIQVMDLWGKLEYVPGPKGLSEMRLDSSDGKTYGGFFAFRRLVWMLPMLYAMVPIVYFPGAGILGPLVYRWVARNRYLFPVFHSCANGKVSFMILARNIPKVIWIHTILIITIGLMSLYSASFNNNVVDVSVFYDQLFCAGLGILLMFLLARGDYRKFFDVAYIVYGISVVFLILVLVMGRQALGATRWFSIAGVSFQPSEFSKLAVIFFLGRYFSQRRTKLSFDFSTSLRGLWGDLIWPLILTIISVALIFKQPDLGTAILVMGIFLIMLYTSGIALKIYFSLLGVLTLLMPLAWHFLKNYQKDRLLVFLDPSRDPLGAGYTITQSKIAVGSGELLGKGWLSGTQNQLNFLPERHTDFIFSVIGEEWGLLGGLVLIYCYGIIIYCGFKIARHNKDPFGQLVAVGIVSILAMQVVINIGMVMGLLPVVGITLPLISYGRTSFMVFAILLGFLLNLSRKRTIF